MEIEFRGKPIKPEEFYNAEWLIGDLCHYSDITCDRCYIAFDKDFYDIDNSMRALNDELSTDCYGEVDPNTVGQFTGQKVKNEKLFADDIIMATMSDGSKIYKLVVWDSKYMGFGLQNLPISQFESVQHFCNNDNYLDRFDIVGNKFDNPDLMGVGK